MYVWLVKHGNLGPILGPTKWHAILSNYKADVYETRQWQSWSERDVVK